MQRPSVLARQHDAVSDCDSAHAETLLERRLELLPVDHLLSSFIRRSPLWGRIA